MGLGTIDRAGAIFPAKSTWLIHAKPGRMLPVCIESLGGSKFLQPRFNVAFPGFLVKQAKLERLAVRVFPVPCLALGQQPESLLEAVGARRLVLASAIHSTNSRR